MLACHARRDLPAYYRLNRCDPRPHQPRGAQHGADADVRHAQPAHPEPALPLELRRRQVGKGGGRARAHGRRRWRRATAPRSRGCCAITSGRRARPCSTGCATRRPPAPRPRVRRHERAADPAPHVPSRRRRRTSRAACAAPSRARCCSTARRAAATPPTRRSTRSMPVGVRGAERATTTCARRSRCAASRAFRCCRAARAGRSAGRPWARRSSSITASISNRVVRYDADARTVTVEPGIVLDALNAWLKPHGVWFPVDVSTSAQCTLGGMAGNNSCGSRSIAYGNMVHNVVGDRRAAGRRHCRVASDPSATMRDAPARVRALVAGLRAIGERERDEIDGQGADGAAPRRRLQHRRVPAR